MTRDWTFGVNAGIDVPMTARLPKPTSLKELRMIGGFKSGLWNAVTWPGAQLIVSAEGLIVSSVYGVFRFSPDEVADVVPHRVIPLLGDGIRVVHTRSDCPAEIIFFPLKKPGEVLEAIVATGFEARARVDAIPDRSASRSERSRRLFGPGFPMLLAMLQLWGYGTDTRHPTVANLVIPALMFLVALAAEPVLSRSPALQAWAVNNPLRPLEQILRVLHLTRWVTAMVLFLFTFAVVLGD